jgi:GTPase SAR1 family protein
LKSAHVILLICDVTDEIMFDDLEKWLKIIKDNRESGSFTLSVLANKIDLEERNWGKENFNEDVSVYEVSAKINEGIKEALKMSLVRYLG